jgi:hypothetical protein
MNQEITRLGLYVLLPLLLTSVFLVFLGEANAVQYEDLVLKQGSQRKQLVSEEEPVITPPIKIVGPER